MWRRRGGGLEGKAGRGEDSVVRRRPPGARFHIPARSRLRASVNADCPAADKSSDQRSSSSSRSASSSWNRLAAELELLFSSPTSKHRRRRQGQGGHVPPPPKQKKSEKKYFSGNYYVKFGHFIGQKSCKIMEFG